MLGDGAAKKARFENGVKKEWINDWSIINK
jgi:hypothetical protein